MLLKLHVAVPSGHSGLGKSGRDFGHADGRPDTERSVALRQHFDHIRSRWESCTAVIQFYSTLTEKNGLNC